MPNPRTPGRVTVIDSSPCVAEAVAECLARRLDVPPPPDIGDKRRDCHVYLYSASVLSPVTDFGNMADSLPDTFWVAARLPPNRRLIASFLSAGALGIVLATESLDDLYESVLWAMRGERRLPPALRESSLARVARQSDHCTRPGRHVLGQGPSVLTSREEDVFRHLRKGRTNKEIADNLGIEVQTAKNYVRRVMQKLGLSSRHDVVLADSLDFAHRRIGRTRNGIAS